MAIRTYADLDVYREAYTVALAVSKRTKSYPRIEQFELVRQLRKAARSVSANIVEGWAKRASTAEFKRCLQVAIGSCDEARMWLDLSRDEGYISARECDEFKSRFNRIGAMLQSLWRRWRGARA